MAIVGWVDSTQLVEDWADSPEDGELLPLLTTAYEVCLAYAPALVVPEPPAELVIPERYKQAQILYAKHLWARKQSGDASSVGPDGYAISTYPLVMESRSLLRPKRSPFAGLL